ncbi:hypothetical protein D3C78_1146420 [compost metagenome]
MQRFAVQAARHGQLCYRIFLRQLDIIKQIRRHELMRDAYAHIPLRIHDPVDADLLKHTAVKLAHRLRHYLLHPEILEKDRRQNTGLNIIADGYNAAIKISNAK